MRAVSIPVTVKMRLGWDDDSLTAPALARAFEQAGVAGVIVHGDDRIAAYGDVAPASDDDFATEYLSLDIAAGVVDSLDDALAHIRRYSTGHSETIVTDSQSAARRSPPRSTRRRCW